MPEYIVVVEGKARSKRAGQSTTWQEAVSMVMKDPKAGIELEPVTFFNHDVHVRRLRTKKKLTEKQLRRLRQLELAL